MPTKGGIELIGTEQFLYAVGKGSEVIGGYLVGLYLTDVVHGVIGEQCDGPTMDRLDREEGDLRIDGTGGLDQIALHRGSFHFVDVAVGAGDDLRIGVPVTTTIGDVGGLVIEH